MSFIALLILLHISLYCWTHCSLFIRIISQEQQGTFGQCWKYVTIVGPRNLSQFLGGWICGAVLWTLSFIRETSGPHRVDPSVILPSPSTSWLLLPHRQPPQVAFPSFLFSGQQPAVSFLPILPTPSAISTLCLVLGCRRKREEGRETSNLGKVKQVNVTNLCRTISWEVQDLGCLGLKRKLLDFEWKWTE